MNNMDVDDDGSIFIETDDESERTYFLETTSNSSGNETNTNSSYDLMDEDIMGIDSVRNDFAKNDSGDVFFEDKFLEFSIDNWNKFTIYKTDSEGWSIELYKNENNLIIKLSKNNDLKPHIHKFIYKFNFILKNCNNQLLSESQEYRFESNEESFSTNGINAFDISEINFGSIERFKIEINIQSMTIYNYDFIDEICRSINDKYRNNVNDILAEDYFEWKFNREDRGNWNDNKLMSNIFIIGGYKWYLVLFKKNNKFFLGVINLDIDDSYKSAYICSNVVFVIRDELCKIKKVKAFKSFSYFYKLVPGKTITNFIEDEDINDLFENKSVIGVYIRIYNINDMDYAKERFINKLEKSIYNGKNTDNYEILKEGYYEWNFYHWNNIYDLEIVNRDSSFFNIGNYKWHIVIYPPQEDDKVKFVLFYDKDNYENIYANFVITIKLSNSKNILRCNVKDLVYFSEEKSKHEIELQSKHYENLKNNKSAVITVYIRIYRKKNELEFRESILRNARIAKVLVGNKFKTIDAKKGDYAIITHPNIDNEHSYGFKINEPRIKGLFKNSNIEYLNESEKDAVLV